MEVKHIAWFSGGGSSAVAIKKRIELINEIYYIHIEDQHEDTLRFIKDCEKWFGKKITILQSKYISVNNALLGAGGRGYVNGPAGAACTRILKKRVRKEWERKHEKVNITYYWGMDASEEIRSKRIIETMREFTHVFPLIEDGIPKNEVHQILKANNIKRPVMYELGYNNNNCIGCVKGGKGYWNKIREDFPKVFELRAKTERIIGGTCIKGIYLDELNPNEGNKQKPIVDDCGLFCELLIV